MRLTTGVANSGSANASAEQNKQNEGAHEKRGEKENTLDQILIIIIDADTLSSMNEEITQLQEVVRTTVDTVPARTGTGTRTRALQQRCTGCMSEKEPVTMGQR